MLRRFLLVTAVGLAACGGSGSGGPASPTAVEPASKAEAADAPTPGVGAGVVPDDFPRNDGQLGSPGNNPGGGGGGAPSGS